MWFCHTGISCFETDKLQFIGVFGFYVTFSNSGESNQRAPLKGERVSFRKKRTCRIFLHFNILSALKDPPLLRALPVAWVCQLAKGCFSPAVCIVAVILIKTLAFIGEADLS